jgi:hypothetical protein
VSVVAAVALRPTMVDIGRILSGIRPWGSVRDGAPAVLVPRRCFREVAEFSNWENSQLVDQHVVHYPGERCEPRNRHRQHSLVLLASVRWCIVSRIACLRLP